MSAITDQLTKFVSVVGGIIEIVRAELEKEKDFISELNQMQLSEGLRPDGSSLPDYSPTSVSVFGKPAGPIKLFDTGDFYKGIEPLFGSDEFNMAGTDDKTDMLISRYGQVLGLSDESIKKLGERIKPRIILEVRRQLK